MLLQQPHAVAVAVVLHPIVFDRLEHGKVDLVLVQHPERYMGSLVTRHRHPLAVAPLPCCSMWCRLPALHGIWLGTQAAKMPVSLLTATAGCCKGRCRWPSMPPASSRLAAAPPCSLTSPPCRKA